MTPEQRNQIGLCIRDGIRGDAELARVFFAATSHVSLVDAAETVLSGFEKRNGQYEWVGTESALDNLHDALCKFRGEE